MNAYRTGKLLRNSYYVVNRDYHTRKTALDIAKEHLSQIDEQQLFISNLRIIEEH